MRCAAFWINCAANNYVCEAQCGKEGLYRKVGRMLVRRAAAMGRPVAKFSISGGGGDGHTVPGWGIIAYFRAGQALPSKH